jgi:hypothetical protein
MTGRAALDARLAHRLWLLSGREPHALAPELGDERLREQLHVLGPAKLDWHDVPHMLVER